VNLVTDRDLPGTHGSASYQVGDFGTHRLTLGLRHLDEPQWLLRARRPVFFDDAQKKTITAWDVDNADLSGRLTPVHADLFHNAYRAGGRAAWRRDSSIAPWAKSLRLRVFFGDAPQRSSRTTYSWWARPTATPNTEN